MNGHKNARHGLLAGFPALDFRKNAPQRYNNILFTAKVNRKIIMKSAWRIVRIQRNNMKQKEEQACWNIPERLSLYVHRNSKNLKSRRL
ncbi:MAG: hypothetical protein LUI85_11940 [Bacteroides sp.]|nr:hypothetical protein [Bacteroides sp.]